MRRMSWLVVASIAAGTLAAQTLEPRAENRAENGVSTPQLIHTTAVDPGDSPLVRAAKRAVAARQSAKNRITIDDRTMRGRGRVSQGTGPTTFSMNLPPSEAAVTSSGQTAADIEKARQKELTTKIEGLRQEQQRMAGEAEAPYGGDDADEERVEQRQSTIPTEIDQVQRQQTPPPPPGR